MTGHLVKAGPHHCAPPASGRGGDIWECDCGRRWKFRNYANRYYRAWYMTWPSSLGLWRFYRKDER